MLTPRSCTAELRRDLYRQEAEVKAAKCDDPTAFRIQTYSMSMSYVLHGNSRPLRTVAGASRISPLPRY